MLRPLAGCALYLVACSTPTDPFGSGNHPPLPSSALSFEDLSSGDSLIVDQHSVSCFESSNLRLLFVAGTRGVVVAGELELTFELADTLLRSQRTSIPLRYLTRSELTRLDNLLALYRREYDQTRCSSTGQHSTTFRASAADVTEHYDTDSCIELELIEGGQSFDIRPRTDILTMYELSRWAFDEVFRRF